LIEPRDSSLLDKCSTTWAMLPPADWFLLLETSYSGGEKKKTYPNTLASSIPSIMLQWCCQIMSVQL
jgi:hypothetical protein